MSTQITDRLARIEALYGVSLPIPDAQGPAERAPAPIRISLPHANKQQPPIRPMPQLPGLPVLPEKPASDATYDVRREYECAQGEYNAVILIRLAIETAYHLGDGWMCDVKRGEYHISDLRLHLLGPDGAKLSFRRAWRDKGKVSISGDFPVDKDGHRHAYNLKGTTSIRVSESRGASVIASEIQRRLLPDYTTNLRDVRAATQKADTRIDKITDNFRTLREILGVQESKSGGIGIYAGALDITSMGDDYATLRFCSVSIELAKKMAQVYADWVQRNGRAK